MRSRNGAIGLVLGCLLVAMLLIGGLVLTYNNSFASMEEDVKGKWAQVENQLKRRADLVPNLVNTVKGYAAHEKEIFSKIAEARSKLIGAAPPAEKMQANAELSGAISRLLMVAEAYPNLKADANFARLQDELAGTENRLAVERQRYNESVQRLNTSMRQLPGSLVAGIMGYKAATYFEAPATDKVAPTVKF